MLELWGMRTPLHCHHSQVHSGPRGVAPDSILSMGQVELNRGFKCLLFFFFFFFFLFFFFSFKLCTYAKMNCLIILLPQGFLHIHLLGGNNIICRFLQGI